jgi:YegS/Rv2252/BmrU family lipid kinase
MADAPYRRIHVVINPASGKDEPILNTLNDVFRQYGVDWDVSITKKYGDAAVQAKAALAGGADLVVGYGGDGTQHELANAVLEAADASGSPSRMGILPGGTGNGFAREMGVPGTLREAAEALCRSTRVRAIDVGRLVHVGEAKVPDRYFVQRLYVGIEPEEQTSRELKDRYGVFAYAVNMAQHGSAKEVLYHADVDGQPLEFQASKVYVVNSGMMGTGLRITHSYAVDDGLLDAFAIDGRTHSTMVAAAARFLDLHTASASQYLRQCRTLRLETTPDQPVWTDGEYIGRTPVSIEVAPGALSVVVP